MKKTIRLLIALLLLAATTACHKLPPADAVPEDTAQSADAAIKETAQPAPAETQEAAETDAPAGRQDGERFEEIILLEGMEETVRYEHVRNDSIGFEMDYDYESLLRKNDGSRERFISIYDDTEAPENYLEVTRTEADAETAAASVSESLSDEYDIVREAYALDRAGSCIRIDASRTKDGGMPPQPETVYIIPVADGALVATAHFTMESAEGFGRRFDYMMNTLEVIGSDPNA